MVTKDQSMTAHMFHYGSCKRLLGPKGGVKRLIQERWRRNGDTRLWKLTPERWEIPIKNGLYNYSYLNNRNAREFHTEADCPLNQES